MTVTTTYASPLRDKMDKSLRNYREFVPGFDKVVKPLEEKMVSIASLMDDCRELENSIKNHDLYGEEFEKEYGVKLDVVKTTKNFVTKDSSPSNTTPVEKENNENITSAERKNEETEDDHIVFLLSEKEFNSIPKYMLGRFTIENLNEIITKLDEFFTMKNNILTKQRKLLTKNEREKMESWRALEENSKKSISSLFCLESDIRPLLQEKLRPSFVKSIPCLRHVRRLREERCGKLTFYFP